MGLRDRLNAAKSWMKCPVTVTMLDRGSDKRVRAGKQARVVVDVTGENDGTVERIEVVLRRTSNGPDGDWVDVDLGEVPTEPGTHELLVTIPPGTLPSTIGFSAYVFRAQAVRSKGVESDAVSPVEVIGRVEDLYWPDGPRTGTDGRTDVRIDLACDTTVAAVGTTLTGRVAVQALSDLRADSVEIELGTQIVAFVTKEGSSKLHRREKFRVCQALELAPKARLASGAWLDLPFAIPITPGLPVTLRDGEASSVWQVRVRRGDATAWATIGVVDPAGLSVPEKERSTIAGLLG